MKEQDGLKLLSRYRGAIMGFAALWIFFYHEWQPMLQATGLAFTESFVKRIGFCGVDIFLLLSGMGLSYALEKERLHTFYYRRFKRLYLPFLLVGICYLVLKQWDGNTFWGNVTGVNFYRKNMYSFLWFVPAIGSLYLVFPLYYKLFARHQKPITCLAAALAIWLIASIALRDTLRYDLFGFTNRLPVFLVGVYLGWRSRQGTVQFTLGTWILLVFTLACGLYLSWETNFNGYYLLVPVSNCCIPNLLISVSLPFLLAGILDVLQRVKYLGKGSVKFLGFFGMFSLEFYCVQEAIGFQLMPQMYAAGRSAGVINLVMILTATAAGLLLYLCVKYFWKGLEWGCKKLCK